MLRIVIAEDHTIIRKGLIQILKEEIQNLEIGEAANIIELNQLLHHEKWDMVISDISMPGRSGMDNLKQIKDLYPILPVLMISIHPEEQYAIRSLKGGANGYITKDSATEELLLAIKTILSGHKYISATLAEHLAKHLSQKERGGLPHETLSDREFDVLKMITSGKTVSEIAKDLSLSATTISTYRSRILEKMHMRTNAELTQYAVSQGIA